MGLLVIVRGRRGGAELRSTAKGVCGLVRGRCSMVEVAAQVLVSARSALLVGVRAGLELRPASHFARICIESVVCSLVVREVRSR